MREGETKVLKGGQAESRSGCPKKGGMEPPCELCKLMQKCSKAEHQIVLCLNHFFQLN